MMLIYFAKDWPMLLIRLANVNSIQYAFVQMKYHSFMTTNFIELVQD